jgi:hypothetical protein
MQLLGSDLVWSIAVVAAFWFALIAVISLIQSKWDVAECLVVWRFALLGTGRRLKELVSGSQTMPDSQATAKQLSDVLQIPIVDAELSLQLSGAFFDQTNDPELNGEAVDLLFSPTARNETWRARASECCRKLRANGSN